MQHPQKAPPSASSPVTEEFYRFEDAAEADATYLIIAWFAVTESASLGIFPLLSALETARQGDPAYFERFFEHGFQHFTDEQSHANMWCRALLDFTRHYPEVVRRVKLPRRYLQIMLKSIGKPHSVLSFAVDCLAFEVVMQALYDVLLPRLTYPPTRQILQVISRDEEIHTAFGRHYLSELLPPRSRWQRLRMSFRFWRNMAGVLITVDPLIKGINLHRALTAAEFRLKVAEYSRQSGIIGSRRFMPGLLARLS